MSRLAKRVRPPRVTRVFGNVMWVVIALALAAGILVGSAAAGSAPNESSPSPASSALSSPDPSAAPSWLAAVAANIADQNTDGAKAAAGAVTSRWALCGVKEAAPLMGADAGEVPPELAGKQCYVIVMKGSFTATKAFVPKGCPDPEGTTIVCLVDPVTHKILGFSLWPQDLAMDTSSVPALAPLPVTAE